MFKKVLDIIRINQEMKKNERLWGILIAHSNQVITNYGVNEFHELPENTQDFLSKLLDRAIELEVRNFELSIQKETL